MRICIATMIAAAIASCSAGCGPTIGSHQSVSIDSGTPARQSSGSPTTQPSISPIHFTLKMDRTNVDFRHRTGNSSERPFPAANGSGIGAIDYDRDGNWDLYFATGRAFPLDQPDDANRGNRLYRNVTNWSFEDVSESAGIGHFGYSAGIAVGDYDGDGFSDLYVTCYGPNALFQNCGDGTFRRVSEAAGVNDDRWGTSAAFLDYDGDGNLDLYVCNYAKWSLETNRFCGDEKRNVRIFCSPNSVEPDDHLLFHNESDGTFHEASRDAGLGIRTGRGQGVIAADVDLDGRIDLFVGNDLQPNFLYRNAGGGKFVDISGESGAAYDKSGNAHAGMGVDAADLNADGLPELFVTNFEQEYNTCYENLGHASFQDISESNGLAAASRPWVGWGTALIDLDSDGLRDVIVTNGHTDHNMAEMGRDSEYRQPPLVWRNQGKRFKLVAETAGDYFRSRHPGRALSVADIDNDGDFDVIIGHQDESPALLCNDSLDAKETGKRTLSLQLVGRTSSRDAIGVIIQIESGNRKTYHQIRGGGSYLSAHDLRVIGVCVGEQFADVIIRWPSGIESSIKRLSTGKRYVIVEPRDNLEPPFCCEMDG